MDEADSLMSSWRIDIKRDRVHRLVVRTTLTLDDDVLDLVARRAKLRGVSLGKSVSDLLRRGLSSPTPSEKRGGVVVFRLPADSPRVTTEVDSASVAIGKPKARIKASIVTSTVARTGVRVFG